MGRRKRHRFASITFQLLESYPRRIRGEGAFAQFDQPVKRFLVAPRAMEERRAVDELTALWKQSNSPVDDLQIGGRRLLRAIRADR